MLFKFTKRIQKSVEKDSTEETIETIGFNLDEVNRFYSSTLPTSEGNKTVMVIFLKEKEDRIQEVPVMKNKKQVVEYRKVSEPFTIVIEEEEDVKRFLELCK